MLRALLQAGLLALGLGLGGTAAAAAQDPGTIRWVVFDLPPHFTYFQGRPPRSVDELANGEVDGFLRQLLARMPEYRHEFVEASTARYEALTRSGETLCSALHVRTPQRLHWLYFSHLYPPLASREIHVVVRRDRLEALAGGRAEGERLKLADLLQRRDWHTLLARDRSFGPQIDKLLAGSDLPRLPVGGAPAHRILDMLRAGRVDYTLEYPSVVADYLGRSGDAQALVTLPMAEGLATTVATVACSRNPLGLRHIEAIDEAVRRLARDPQRETWIRAWRGELLDAGDLKRLNAYMDERGRSGPRIE
jgi:uncharacterized protein (TIGR02285 family)